MWLADSVLRGRLDTHKVGRRFEAAAERALVAAGFTVVDRNVRFGRREVDLVVRSGTLIAFVEVKGRRGSGCGDPLEAITRTKRAEIEAVAHWWVSRFGMPGDRYRFDAVAVRVEGAVVDVEHVADAWRCGE